MKRLTSLLLFLLLVWSLNYATALEITPHPGSENPVDSYQNVRLNVVGATLDDLKSNSKVFFPPAKGTTINEVATWGGEPYLLFESKSLGHYWIGLAVVIGGKLETATYVVQVDTDPNPDPPDPPDPPVPPPPPPPTPIEDLWSIVVGETGDWTAAHSIVLNSKQLRGLFKTPQRFRVFDKDLDTNEAARAWFSKVPTDAPLPYWFLVDGSNGRVAWEGELPVSVDKAIETVSGYLPKLKTRLKTIPTRAPARVSDNNYRYTPFYTPPGSACTSASVWICTP